jgi:hypothetical protein
MENLAVEKKDYSGRIEGSIEERNASKDFITWLYSDKENERIVEDGFSTSGKRDEDMKEIFSGDFEIKDLTTNGESGTDLHIHFRVGMTDFYIQDKASIKFEEILKA